ncbi:BnaC07g50820D [Brassica napus]|uniref:BnaC07g50820D protein n=2 Tax=Brassica TaxID=3705 RepID=A0A078IT11_BRANA|nr:BnaC07g50820D [Brassica napus]VDD40617.1 unnamed protein product [Brassica oleracea]
MGVYYWIQRIFCYFLDLCTFFIIKVLFMCLIKVFFFYLLWEHSFV